MLKEICLGQNGMQYYPALTNVLSAAVVIGVFSINNLQSTGKLRYTGHIEFYVYSLDITVLLIKGSNRFFLSHKYYRHVPWEVFNNF